jgi:hypothetical protein
MELILDIEEKISEKNGDDKMFLQHKRMMTEDEVKYYYENLE